MARKKGGGRGGAGPLFCLTRLQLAKSLPAPPPPPAAPQEDFEPGNRRRGGRQPPSQLQALSGAERGRGEESCLCCKARGEPGAHSRLGTEQRIRTEAFTLSERVSFQDVKNPFSEWGFKEPSLHPRFGVGGDRAILPPPHSPHH